jgi:hypothetical protein
MHWRKCCVFLLAIATTLPALATDKPGFYMAAGMASYATTAGDSGLVGLDSLPSTLKTDSDKTEFRGTIAVGYLYPLGPKYLVMLEAGKDVGSSTQFSTDAVLIAQNGYSSEIDREWRFKRHWFVAVKPAMRISDATLAYLSLSHHQAYVSGRSDLWLDCNNGTCNTITSFAGGGSLNGTGIGLGLQTTFEKIWFLRAEVESIRFNQFTASVGDPAIPTAYSSENLHLKSTVGRVMVGYRF